MEYVYVPVKATGPADLNITVSADDFGQPGATLEVIQVTNALSSVGNSVGIVSANSITQPFLQAGNQYWITVAPPDLRNTFFAWFFSPQNAMALTPTQAFAVFGTQSVGLQPSLAPAGVLDAASYRTSVSPGSWIAIFGMNLAPLTRSWQSSDFFGNSLPLSLSGVEVQISGVPAAVSYISPGQINAQVPESVDPLIGPGLVTVQVITPSGASGLVEVDAEPYAPSFFTFDTGEVAYVAPSYPVKSGDMISLYGSGFGPTTPSVPTGQLFTGAAPLAATDQLTITIGGIPVTVQFAGISEAGLYQFNVTVPALADGMQPITAQINGSITQPGVYLTIGN